MMTKKLKMIKTKCPICGSKKNYEILYKSNFKLSDFNREIFSARRMPDRIHYQIVRCNKDGLVRSNPILSPSKLFKLYEVSSLDYGDETKNLANTYFNNLKKVLSLISKKDNILEIGCGNGFLLEKLSREGFKNVYGIEPSKDAVNKAKADIKKRIYCDVLKKDIIKDKKFKLICFFQTLDHIPSPNSFLDECYRLLEKGGFIVSFNHNIEGSSSKILKEKSPIIDIEHTVFYSPKTIQKLFEKHKFKVLQVYSPSNIISIKHFIKLFPMPRNIKNLISNTKYDFLNLSFPLKLGNLCLI